MLQMPGSLHNQRRLLAKQVGVSINQLIANAPAEKVAALLTEEYLEERASRRASRERFRAVLNSVPDAAPAPEDEIGSSDS